MSENQGGVRCVALVGPYLSGKTTLLESLLHVAGAIHRKGSVTEGTTVGNFSPEARARQMGVELNVAQRNIGIPHKGQCFERKSPDVISQPAKMHQNRFQGGRLIRCR